LTGVHRHPYNSYLVGAFSRGSLVVFLSANLLTGAVNLGMETIHQNTGVSMLVLTSYTVCVSLFAWVWDERKFVGN